MDSGDGCMGKDIYVHEKDERKSAMHGGDAE